MKIAFKTLVALLGKPVDDPAVKAAIATVGKVSVKPDFIVAKEAGFDFSLDQPAGSKPRAKRVLTTLFLFGDGEDKHTAFADLPKPFKWGARAEVTKGNPPDSSWTIDHGDAPGDAAESERDSWNRDGYILDANYARKGEPRVKYFTLSLPEELSGVRDVATHPLHFETSPADAPDGAELVGMALLVAWAADRFGVPDKHAGSAQGKALAKRAITPRTFLVEACNGTLATLDFKPAQRDFIWAYSNRMHDDPDAEREAAKRVIKKWLNLERADEGSYNDDYLGTFKKAVKFPAYVPDSWDAVDRISPVLDARWADYAATKLVTAPDLKLYEKAAKLRDAVKIVAWKKTLAPVPGQSADPKLATDLIACIDKPLADKSVQDALARAGLPVGKKIDEQANAALGVSYLGVKIKVAGKSVMGFHEVTFFAAKQKSYIRGMGKEVEFRGYPGVLPLGLELGMPRATVEKLLGKAGRNEKHDIWFPRVDRRIAVGFSRANKLVWFNVGKPADWLDAPEPPYGPKGLV